MIEGSDLAKRYDTTDALQGVTVQLPPGQVTAILGPNGAGKTTLVRLLHLLDHPDQGHVRWDGQTVTPDDLHIRRRLALVPQDLHLFRGTTQDNAALPLKLRRWPDDRIDRRTDELLQRFDLTHLADRPAAQLSGGEAQRLAFARALAPHPDVLFLDEFASNLDRKRLHKLEDEIRHAADQGTAVCLITHDPDQIRRLAHRALHLHAGQIQARGPPDKVLNAAP